MKPPLPIPVIRRRAAALVLVAFAAGCSGDSSGDGELKVIRYPVRAKIGNLDPVRNATQYQSHPTSAIFDRLVDYRYPRAPFELMPAMLESMPGVSDDGLVYSFSLKAGIVFQDDPCFPDGRGREVITDDVFYSLKRMADPHWGPTGYWLYDGRIEGLDEYKAEQSRLKREAAQAGRPFEFGYDVPVSGLRRIDDHHFQIVLTDPFPQFLYVLAMPYASVVPREALEMYDLGFGRHPVGSGPFRLREFRRGSWLTLERNPTYRDDFFPSDLNAEERAMGMGEYAGRRLPLLDRIVFEIYEQDQPMWLKFRAGDLDIGQAPAEYWPTAFFKDGTPRPWLAEQGIRTLNLPLLDLIYWGFNMQDPIWGTPPQMKLVRQGISYAVDLESRNQAFYNNKNALYQGPIPPGLEGYESGYRRQDIERARSLLAQAGFPGGEGLPPLLYETSKGGNIKQQAEMFTRQLAKIGIEVEPNFNSFPELDDKLKKRKAAFFGLAWGADYPDAENFLQLFYGPNASPGSNNFNFAHPRFDSLFAAAKALQPSPERTEIYSELRDIVIDEMPMIGSMARTRFYLWHERVKNFKPEEVYSTWWRYLDVVSEPVAETAGEPPGVS